MRIMITGGTGLIGHALAQALGNDGHKIVVLTRDSQRNRIPAGADGVRWDARGTRGWGNLIDKDTVIINLAGEPVRARRWSERHKERVLGTRIETARAVLRGINESPIKPRLLIQPSYVGYYGDRGDEILTEQSAPGEGFRAESVKVWERATNGIEAQTRRVIFRMGHVLSTEGGVLPGLRFAALLGGRYLGDGTQYVSWLHIEDVVYAVRYALKNENVSGLYNLTAPTPCTNQELMDALRRVRRFPALINMSEGLVNLALGDEQARVVLDSQRVLPERLTGEGFRFKYEEIEWALRQLLRGSVSSKKR